MADGGDTYFVFTKASQVLDTGVVDAEGLIASNASRSSAPVTDTIEIVFPNGNTVYSVFIEISPGSMEARIPPPWKAQADVLQMSQQM